MNLESTEKLSPWQGMLEAGWLLVAILTPLWVNLWGSRPFDPAKLALLRVLVILMAAGWVSGRLLQRRPWRALRHDLPPTTLLAPLLAVAIAAVAATVAASNPTVSVWGSHERAFGLVALLSYVLLAVVTGANLRGVAQARRLLGAMALTAIPLLLLGALQALGRDPLGLSSDARSPIYGTLGRANFVGAYLALLLPLTLALAASRREARVGLLLLAAGQAALMALTVARAAWLAAAVGLLVLALGWAWLTLDRGRRRWAALAAFLLLLGGLLAAAGAVWQAEGGSLAARRVIWRSTWRLIGERPLLGYGPDSLGVHFAHVFPPQLVYYQGRQVFVDRAHNWLLDRTVTQGVLGLVAFCWLWGAALWVGWRAVCRAWRQRARERALLLLGCLAALGANLAGNLFSFDVAATAAAGWLLLGVIIGLSREDVTTDDAPLAQRQTWRVALVALLLGGAIWLSWWSSGRFLLADAARQRSLRLAGEGNMVEATAAAQEAAGRWPQEAAYWQQLAELRGAQGELLAAEGAWQRALALRGNDARLWSARGQFYATVAAEMFAQEEADAAEALSRAHEALAQATDLAPDVARLYVARARVYILDGEWASAVGQLEQAVDLDTTDWLAWQLLAEAYAAQERPAAAQAAREQAEHWSDQSLPVETDS